MTTKHIVAAIAAVVIAAAIAGGYYYPKIVPQGSAAGTTFNTAKVAQINITPTSLSATTTSILNGDSYDRYILDSFINCATTSGSVYDSNPQTTGVPSWIWKAATTTTSSLGLQGNTNLVVAMSVGTSTTDYSYNYQQSTTTANYLRQWKAGTYLTWLSNATSSNKTISCQVGVHYIGS